MKVCAGLIIIMLLAACSGNTGNKKESSPALPVATEKNALPVKKTNGISQIDQLDRDSCSIHWYGGGIFSLCFEKGRVYYFFNAQCIYWYKTRLAENKIRFAWDYNENCTFDRGLKNTYGLKVHPIKGKPFGEFELINDSTLKATYFYPEWVQKINQIAKDVDTLFPVIFKIKQ
jgi:hypothetical protein